MQNKNSTLYIAGICTILFILQLIFPIITNMFVLKSFYVIKEPWTLITSMFLHGSIVHILQNMFALILFGIILESIIGTKKFLINYLIAGILAGLSSIFFYNSVLGASGAIMGIIGCLAVIKPKMQMWIMGIPMPMYIAGIIYLVLDLFGILMPSNIANISHIGGLLSGVIFGFLIRQKTPKEKEDKMYVSEEEMQKWENDYLK